MKWLLPKRNRTKERLRAGTEKSNDTRWNAAKFDETTGQVYLETTAVRQTYDDRDWARDCRLVQGADYRDAQEYEDYVRRLGAGRKDLEKYQKRLDGLKNSKIRGYKGARSLQDAAIECVLENISDVTLEGIECLPISIVRRIWHAVNKRCSRCFNTWSIFATILRQDDNVSLNLLRYHQNIKAPNCRLDVYTNPLTSKSYDFITSLSITASVPIQDLIKVANVTNLGVLEIINTQGGENMTVGDRLIRSWYAAALNEGAFSVLRILRLWKHEGLTTKSLEYLNGFPALALYDVQGCSFDHEAKVEATRFGWRATLVTDVVGLLERACAERATLMRSNLGVEAGAFKKTHSERLWHGAKVKRRPRGDVPNFLAQAQVPTLDIVETPHMEPDPNGSMKAHSKSQDRQKESATQSHSEGWDISTYRAFSRIGELRNDTDLVRAGIEVGDQAIAGSELINSIPMVSLRLGESPSWLVSSSIRSATSSASSSSHYSVPVPSIYDWKEKPRLANSTLRGLAFIRIKAPPPADLAAKDPSRDTLRSPTQNVAGSEVSTLRPLKRPMSGIVKNKKRKLDDVLGSFF